MKTYTFLIFLLFPFCYFAQDDHSTCSKAKRFQNSVLKSNTLTLSEIAQTNQYDVHYYFLNLNLTDTSTQVSGSAEMHATALSDLDTALLEFSTAYTISSIEADGIPVMYSHQNTALRIPVNKLQGQPFKIRVTYSGAPINNGSMYIGDGLFNSPQTTNFNAVTFTYSEPFSAYKWFPVKQSLKDKADSCAVWITVPDSCKAGSNGILEQVVDLANGTHRFEWKHRHPIDYYLISLAVSKYQEYNITAYPTGSSPVLIQNYILPSMLQTNQPYIDTVADMMELFADSFGPYPFADEKYGHCIVPFLGGMEHQTMTTLGGFAMDLTSHELAHQWFGDNVTCSSWADIWVNEGLASYAEYLMLENLSPGDELQNMLNVHAHVMFPNNPGGSVWVQDSLDSGSIFDQRLVYDKGAAIMHTLRFLVGDDQLFFDALKQYQIIYKDSVASGIQLVEVFENISGKDFADFLEEWYFGEGYPTYSVRWNKAGNDLLLEINQTTSYSFVTPFFTNDLELRFERNGLADTIIRFPINGLQNYLVIPNASAYTNITAIDPNNWICNKSNGIINDTTLHFSAGLTNASVKPLVNIYPNPSDGPLTVEMNTPGNYYLLLLDSKGSRIISQHFTNSTLLDLSNQVKGTYILQIISESCGEKITRLINR
jgi:aminopeptidase N